MANAEEASSSGGTTKTLQNNNVSNNSPGGASEDRGVTAPSPTDKTTHEPQSKKQLSFSNIVKASNFPRKDQAVIFPVIENLLVKDYVIATGKLIGPKSILFASRMSNNRVCLYLASREMVESFIDKHGGINVNKIFVPARKLIIPANRIIISNVSPFIPHHIIEDALAERNIKLMSPISFIGAGIGIDEFKHVLSFRRQVYVASDSSADIPSSLAINFEGESYRIFLSDDKIRCFTCKDLGHIASNCPTSIEAVQIPKPTVNDKRPHSSTDGSTFAAEMEVDQALEGILSVPVESATGDIALGSTIGLPSLLSPPDISTPAPREIMTHCLSDPVVDPTSESCTSQVNTTFSQILIPPPKHSVSKIPTTTEKKLRKQPLKKRRVDSQMSQETFDNLADMWNEDPEANFLLDYSTFTDFLNKVKGKENPLDIASNYTSNISGLITLIDKARRFLTQRSTKERCKRLMVSLTKCLKEDGPAIYLSPTESQLSLDSVMSQDSN